jgi:predicted RNase H-like HicB family nuclease/DNA-binding XRE family transcriptional regulator
MHYVAYIHREGKHWLAEFPDCPGCQTFAESGGALLEAAREALDGWLEAYLVSGQVPPRPKRHTRPPAGKRIAPIHVNGGLTAALEIRWARHEAGLSQKQLGQRARVSQQQIARLENPDENPTIETLEKVARALNLSLNLTFEKTANG